jgi:hypothetical protein
MEWLQGQALREWWSEFTLLQETKHQLLDQTEHAKLPATSVQKIQLSLTLSRLIRDSE